MVPRRVQGCLETLHFRHECLRRVNKFYRPGQLSDILFEWNLKRTTWGFQLTLKHTICLSQWKNKVLLSFSITTEMQRKKKRRAWISRLNYHRDIDTQTHIHTHTKPNLPHILLTVLSEDVYTLPRDLLPIWQSQEHLNGLWRKRKTPVGNFIWTFAGQGFYQWYWDLLKL